jgi:peptidoglycan hydrolase-like protein with peptidoglycan-binding domain
MMKVKNPTSPIGSAPQDAKTKVEAQVKKLALEGQKALEVGKSWLAGANDKSSVSKRSSPEAQSTFASSAPLAAQGAVKTGLILGPGSSGPAVKTAQEQLVKAGYELPDFGADGQFGVETESAVRRFQTDKKLSVNGTFDGPTLSALKGTTPALQKGAQGEAVRVAQEQLMKAGYELPNFGADGDFGNETVAAVKQFQADKKLTTNGTLDTPTLEALKKAKPAAAVQYPEYDKMMSDGVLSTTIAVGYDEDGNDVSQRKEVVEGLVKRGFQRLDVTGLSDAQLQAKGLDASSIDKSATYYLKTMEHQGKPVQSLVKLVDRNATNPKGQFANAMKKDDLVIYSGHARYGSGPDFDDIKKKDGNFVIGEAYEQGHVNYGGNDLKNTKLSDNYQLMFFDGCSTKHYVDDLRSIPKNKSADNLDIVASNRPVSWSTGTSDVFTMLDGVMAKKSIQDIKGGLDKINAEAGAEDAFLADGFKGNSYRPANP